MAIDEVYLCKDCKFSKISLLNNIVTLGGRIGAKSFMYKCSNAIKPAHDIIDPVHGNEHIKATMPFCTIERTNDYQNTRCGPTGKNWAPKHKKDLFKMLTKETHD
jgi:hypothetical protein